MEIVGAKQCPKHNKEALTMCTQLECAQDILVCPECTSRHSSHQNYLITLAQLNDKVHQLMKKRVDFEKTYDKACDSLITQLKKFKLFKQQIMGALNYRERCLNQLCKKIKRTIPYEKDKHLFKHTLNHAYLAMHALNPNYQLYSHFQEHIKQTIKDCKNCINRLVISNEEIPLLMKKESHICSILQKTQPHPIDDIKYEDPAFKQFKKETVKFQAQNTASDSKLLRISNDEFLAFNSRSNIIRLYNTEQFMLPKLLPVSTQIQNISIVGRHLFIGKLKGEIMIYDLLNQRIVKEYASSKHKSAEISSLLSVDSSTVLNFITCPNQIVALKYNDQTETLKIIKGIETKSKCFTSELCNQHFYGCFEDKVVRLYRIDQLQKEREYQFQHLVKSMTKMDQNTLLVAGESQFLSLIDKRAQGIVSRMGVGQYGSGIKKIYLSSVLISAGKKISIFECRMQKQMISMSLQDNVKHIEVLNSLGFVTSGKSMTYFKSL